MTTETSTALPRAVTLLLGLAAAVVALAGLKSAASIVAPAFFALVLTIAVHPLHVWLRGKGFPVWAAIGSTLLVVYGILVALVASLVVTVAQFATVLPGYQDKFNQLIKQAQGLLGQFGVGQEQVQKSLNVDGNRVFSVVGTVLNSTVGMVSALTFIITLLLFMAVDAATFDRRMAIVRDARPEIAAALASFSDGTRKYLLVSTIFGLIVAVMDTVALAILGVPLPILWGLLSFITNYIPNIGFVLGLVPPALLGLLEGGPVTAVLVVVVYSVINFAVQSVIQPRFVGATADLSLTMTVASLVFWAWVLGPLGALLSIPLTLLVKALLVDADPSARWANSLITLSDGREPKSA